MISAGTEFPERPESNSLTKNLGSSQTGDLQSEADKADRYSTNSDGTYSSYLFFHAFLTYNPSIPWD